MTQGDREAIKQRLLDTLGKAPAPMSESDLLPAFSPHSQTFLARLLAELEAAGLVSSRKVRVRRSNIHRWGGTASRELIVRVYQADVQ